MSDIADKVAAIDSARQRRLLLKGALTSHAALAVNVGVGLVLTSIVVRQLGVSQFGLWAIIGSVVHYASLAGIGLPEGINRQTAFESGAGRASAAFAAILAGFMLMSGLGLLAGVALVAAADPLAQFFNVAPEGRGEFQAALAAMALAIVFGIGSAALAAGLQGLERLGTLNAIVIVASLVKLAVTVVLLDLGWGLMALAGGIVLSNLVLLAGCLAALLAAAGRGRRPSIDAVAGQLRPLLRFTAGTAVLGLACIVVTTSGVVVAGRLLAPAEVAIVAVVMMVAGHLLSLVVATLRPLSARLANLAGAERTGEQARLLFRALLVAGSISFAFLAMMVVAGEDLLVLWLGEAFRSAALPLALVVVAYAISVAQVPLLQLILARSQHHRYALLVAAEAVVNVGLSIWLGLRYGILGVVLGTALPLFVFRGFITGIWGCRLLGLGLRRYALTIAAPALAALLAIAVGANLVWPSGFAPAASLALGLPLTGAVFVVATVAIVAVMDRVEGTGELNFIASMLPAPVGRLLARRVGERGNG